ncbi:MAG: hypothetical protein ACR2JQ_04980 [Mycobacteriales bacterium]
MRSRANDLTPRPGGILKDTAAFVRRGTSGSGRELLTATSRPTTGTGSPGPAPPDLLRWPRR